MAKICYCPVCLPHIRVTHFNIGSAAAVLHRRQSCCIIRRIQSIQILQMLGILSANEMLH